MSSNAGLYLQRLVEDDYVHEQITEAVSRLHKAYRRADRKKGVKAAEDKKLYEHVRAAAGSLRRAGTALQRKPAKPKHRGRKLAAAAALVAGAALATRRLASSEQS